MDELEDKILSKIESINDKKTASLNHKGSIEKKKNDTVFEIVNISDFDTELHGMLNDILNNTIMKAKQIEVKELLCKNEDGFIVFEAVMDSAEENYFISNLVFRIYNIKLIRVKTDETETFFCVPHAHDDKIRVMIFKTDKDYIADIEEAKEKNKLLIKEMDLKELKYNDKKIRYAYSLDKLFIN